MNTPITHLPINDIKVGKRLRSDMGDIAGLAESIQEHGLLHPLIVAEDNTLIAGERRLRAMRQLGYEEVPVRFWQSLGANDRRVIELEENVRRKDLTELERSRKIVKLADVAQEVLAEPAKTLQGGRPSKRRVPEQQVSEFVSIPRKTIEEARAHVAIAEEFPTLGAVRKTDAVKIARKLNAMEPEEREATAELIRQNDPVVITTLADKPAPAMSETPAEAAASSYVRWKVIFADIYKRVASMTIGADGITSIAERWTVTERDEMLFHLDQTIASLTNTRDQLQGMTNEPQA
jgi:ParB-like chromosome segregation protein Spo0J